MQKNFYPIQYNDTDSKPINHNYLTEQFYDHEEIFSKIKEVVIKGDFTLGKAVDDFEERFAKRAGTKYAVGVGSGTDAIFLSLKAMGVGDHPEDEVIVPSFTFYATIGAIVTAGAKPVFVDIGSDFNIDPSLIEEKITAKTKAILPVHWSGKLCDMDAITQIAKKHDLRVVEDACHAITATYKGKLAGSFGDTGCFSLHPLKNLNVWGDGGFICTNSDELASRLRLMRNHGLSSRDTCEVFAYNSRLDTIQAIVGDHLLNKIDHITEMRRSNAYMLDEILADIPQIRLPRRDHEHIKQVFHIYSFCAERRDDLDQYLQAHGIDSKRHYPVPMHLQPAAKDFGFKEGDLPVTEKVAATTMSLPVHEFINRDHIIKMGEAISLFYSKD